ncbi:hypothetical protein OIV83_006005 [Microbotryomycetes sp. JL201]|nr:hypothetical protein OIV83_006005 [Microbotryomycetes sp. JL201]
MEHDQLSDDDGASTPGHDDGRSSTGRRASSSSGSKRKVDANNEELRKEQNRRAQRDFRQASRSRPVSVIPKSNRKLTSSPRSSIATTAQAAVHQSVRHHSQSNTRYTQELEAKVALQGTARDEQIDLLGKAIEQLVEENVKLRELLAGVTGFIGEGLGGYLPRIGMELQQFNSIATQTRLDTITSVIDRVLPNARETVARQVSSAPGNPPPAKRKRATGTLDETSQDSANPTAPASMAEQPAVSSMSDAQNNLFAPALALSGLKSPNAPFTLPPPARHSPTSVASSTAEQQKTGPFAVRTQTNLRDIVHPSTAAVTTATAPSLPGTGTSTPTSRAPPVVSANSREENEAHNRELRSILPISNGTRLNTQGIERQHAAYEQKLQELFNQPTDNPKLQAIQMISYHMRNKREQAARMSSSETGIIFPSLRDRLILLKDQYDLQTLLEDLMDALDIHGNDILQPCNWELSEKFLKKYWYVIDAEVLGYTNRWRKERGEIELTMKSIVPDGNAKDHTSTQQRNTFFD